MSGPLIIQSGSPVVVEVVSGTPELIVVPGVAEDPDHVESAGIDQIDIVTQAEYDALVTPNSRIMYVVVG